MALWLQRNNKWLWSAVKDGRSVLLQRLCCLENLTDPHIGWGLVVVWHFNCAVVAVIWDPRFDVDTYTMLSGTR